MTARGIRNHNPGNIRRGEPWLCLAEEQPDPAFCAFTEPKYGIRALAVLLRNYRRRHGLKTVESMINRFAPPAENDTEAYVGAVCRALGVRPDEPIDVREEGIMLTLLKAIIRHENGEQPYSVETLLEGIRL